jgi:hypothetical protein
VTDTVTRFLGGQNVIKHELQACTLMHMQGLHMP